MSTSGRVGIQIEFPAHNAARMRKQYGRPAPRGAARGMLYTVYVPERNLKVTRHLSHHYFPSPEENSAVL